MAKETFPIIHGFQLLNEIGGGGFSVVYRAVNFETRATAACKVVSLTHDSPDSLRKSLEKEMKIHSALKHVNVLEFMHGTIVEPHAEDPDTKGHRRSGSGAGKKRKRNEPQENEEDSKNELEGVDDDDEGRYHAGVYMLLELAGGGDLFDKIEPERGVGDNVAQHYFHQLASGLEFVHDSGVCHRDLKPENILLSADGVLKISDFGMCAVFKITDPKGKKKTRLLSERCGSLPYIAPELAGTDPYEAEPIDIWGIGVILYTLLSGSTPWDRPDRKSSEYTRYLSGEIFDHDPWNRFDRDALSLITGMLTPDPARRMTLKDVFHHPWMMRENELTQRGAVSVAEALTQSLRTTGDLDIATPPTLANVNRTDRDGDQIMLTAAHYSQFTQTLMLFSQTSLGQRYTPSWTRFYASVLPGILKPLILETLTAEGIKYKELPDKKIAYSESGELFVFPEDESGRGAKREGEGITRHRLRIGGFDKRKLMYKGTIELEEFWSEEVKVRGTFCVMNREKGNPISWRQLWKGLIMSPLVEAHVLRKRA